MLADIAQREEHLARQLALDREIPLLYPRGPHVRVPKTDGRALVRIFRVEYRQALVRGRGGETQGSIVVLELRVERWIQWQPEVGPCAFEEGRDRVSAAQHRLAAQELRRPGKAQARLEIGIVRVVESAAVPILARQLLRAAERREVALPVGDFVPGCVVFPPQAEVQRQA